MKTNILLFLFFVFSIPTYPQFYKLGNYTINTYNKTIAVQVRTGGTRMEGGEIIHWDGYKYLPVGGFYNDSTTLYIIGDRMILKEDLNPKINLESFYVYQWNFNNWGGRLGCADDQQIYYEHEVESSADNIESNKFLGDKKYLGNHLYRGKDGELYVLSGESLTQLDETFPFDFQTLKRLYGKYYHDKNGFYHLDDMYYDSDKNKYIPNKLADSGRQEIVPEIFDGYMVYGDSVYALEENYAIKLNLNPDKIRNFYYLENDGFFLTDGVKSYSNFDEVKDSLLQNTDGWQLISPINHLKWFVDEDNSMLTLGTPAVYEPNLMDGNKALIKQGEKYLSINLRDSIVRSYDHLLIFDYNRKTYEPLDITQYKYIGGNFYIYKGILYDAEYPVANQKELDIDNLKPLFIKGRRTEYYTDGKSLFYPRGNFDISSEKYSYISYLDCIIKNIDFNTLKAINEDILVDANNIYNGYSGGLDIIPIQNLGFKVVVYTEE